MTSANATCTQYCEVCSCTVQVQDGNVQVCGLEFDEDLDFGYETDCPYEQYVPVDLYDGDVFDDEYDDFDASLYREDWYDE